LKNKKRVKGVQKEDMRKKIKEVERDFSVAMLRQRYVGILKWTAGHKKG
jgi:hypothetical protein